MQFVIVYDRALKAYKTCLLEDAEGCDILVQFDAAGYNEALAISEDYFKDTAIPPNQIRCKESLDEYKQRASSTPLQDQNLTDSKRPQMMNGNTARAAIKEKTFPEDQDEMIRTFNLY